MKIVTTAGTDNIETLTVAYGGEPFSFTGYGVTRVDVVAGGVTISSTGPNVTYDDDKLSVKFGQMGLPSGKYDVVIMLFSSVSPNGVVIVGPLRPQCIVLFMDVL